VGVLYNEMKPQRRDLLTVCSVRHMGDKTSCKYERELRLQSVSKC